MRTALLFLLIWGLWTVPTPLKAQAGGCNSITFSVIKLEPCRYRLFVNNTNPDCYNEATLLLQSGSFTGFTANGADGWVVEQLSQTELLLTHANGKFPVINKRAVDFTFFEPGGGDPVLSVLYPNVCIMEGCAVDFPLEGCPGGSISGAVYRECTAKPYTAQWTIEKWMIALTDLDGNLIASTETGADGLYSFFDLPPGWYRVKNFVPGDWTANVPASGQWQVQVSAATNYVRDFGNCPKCSCDSLDVLIAQESTLSDTGVYHFILKNKPYCFQEYTITVESGNLVDYTLLDTNAVLEKTGPNSLLLRIPDCPCGDPHINLNGKHLNDWHKMHISGAGSHTIQVSTVYDIGAGPVSCTRKFEYPPSAPAPCCPAGTVPGPELVTNGDFEAGNTGFTSGHSYVPAPGALTAGKYSVAQSTQVSTINNQWACTDHTSGSATGKMLVVDGSLNPPALWTVWKQNVPVVAGKTYSFSAWVNNLVVPSKNFDDPQVELYINGKAVAGIVLPENPDQWYRMCVQWTAPATGTAILEVQIGRFDNDGNDFAVDDISFRACEPAPCQADFAVNFIDQCGRVQLVNTSTGGVSPYAPLWSNGSSSQTLDLQLPCGNYTYCLTVTDATNCTSTICKSFTVSDNTPPKAVCVPGIGIDLDANCEAKIPPGFIDGGSTDNCQIKTLQISPEVLVSCDVHTVTLTVTDWCGNTSTCTAGVQTIEVEPPKIQCPPDMVVQGDPDLGGVQIAIPPPAQLSDNCPDVSAVTDHENGLFPCGSATLVTYTASDACGNTATCSFSVIVEDCEPAPDSCCAFALHFVNKYTDGRIKYVRVTGLCDTKICCADPDEWAQSDQLPYNLSWRPADGSPVPYGVAIDNDFLLYLSEPGLNSFQIEWIDQNETVVARHTIDIACDGTYDEDDEDWAQYTSTTGLDDPNLFVFAVREDSEDGESDCEPEEKLTNSCSFTWGPITCSAPKYLVPLQGPPGYVSYNWSVVIGPDYPSIPTGQNTSFMASPGSYVISVQATDASGNTCSGDEEIIIPDVNPDFSWKFKDCPANTAADFTASGLDDVASFSWSASAGTVSACCTNPTTISFPSPGTYTVYLSATDIYGCTHTVSQPVTVDLSCKAGLEVEKFVFCPSDCAGVNTKPVTVTFANLSTGGKCPVTYQWDFGDGNTNTVTNKNDVPHTYTVPCPGGKQYSVTLTMTDADNNTCTETIIADITPCEVDFTYIVCPDGKVIFMGNRKGAWDFPGSHSTAPWPYSDKKDKDGYRQKVVVRYDQSGTYAVKFTGVCDNGGECTIVKEIVIMLECCAKNDRKKDKYYFSGNSGGQFKMKYK
ncbi:MAG: PKD domain-containing protein, partial [Saprospiraceae bacterium]|nr:PKD domain-containing protein [Saprospiraceae bacterium]